ncbi:MAG TPA: hypothetical protein VLT36_00755, partial [Candidatus Dormibacteraeota bacterium]|nr:hypothetical protein [Candidatus Dormibacteraeota bacterium]
MQSSFNHKPAATFSRPFALAIPVILLGILSLTGCVTKPLDHRGIRFIGITKFSSFEKARGTSLNEQILTSAPLTNGFPFDELIVSWNAEMPPSSYLKLEARAIYADGPTRYYTMGLWSGDPLRHPRESVKHQKDADGDVSTDTLVLNRPTTCVQLRLTLGGDEGELPRLKICGLCLTDSKATPAVLPPNRNAWGKTLP